MSDQDYTQEGAGHIALRLEAEGLPQETIERLNKAVQRALLVELAGLAIEPQARVVLRSPSDKDRADREKIGTAGMWVDVKAKDVKVDVDDTFDTFKKE